MRNYMPIMTALPFLVILLGTVPIANAAVIINTSVQIGPFNVFVPCALGGAGEIVQLFGNLHELLTVTFDASGGFHMSFQAQPQGVSGLGLTSGNEYQGTGVTRGEINGIVGAQTTFVNNFYIIGTANAGSLYVHDTITITLSATGVITQAHFITSITCR